MMYWENRLHIPYDAYTIVCYPNSEWIPAFVVNKFTDEFRKTLSANFVVWFQGETLAEVTSIEAAEAAVRLLS